MAASSTDGVCPERWRSAWKRQMTPQLSVATVRCQRNASRSMAVPAACLVGAEEALDAAEPACAESLWRPEPPGPYAEPRQVLVDLADVDQLPVQHGGEAGSVDDQVAHPEVAVHQPRWCRRRPVGREPPKRPLECRCGIAHFVESVAPLGQLLGLLEADPVGVGAVDGGQRLRTLFEQPARAPRRRASGGCAGRSSRRRSALQIRYGLPSATGELSAARMWGTGAPAAAARCCTLASSSMPACTSSGGPVRRISACLLSSPTASKAHVVRLAPPVRVVRFSMLTSPRTGARTSASCCFTCGRTRRVAAPPVGSGSPLHPR